MWGAVTPKATLRDLVDQVEKHCGRYGTTTQGFQWGKATVKGGPFLHGRKVVP